MRPSEAADAVSVSERGAHQMRRYLSPVLVSRLRKRKLIFRNYVKVQAGCFQDVALYRRRCFASAAGLAVAFWSVSLWDRTACGDWATLHYARSVEPSKNHNGAMNRQAVQSTAKRPYRWRACPLALHAPTSTSPATLRLASNVLMCSAPTMCYAFPSLYSTANARAPYARGVATMRTCACRGDCGGVHNACHGVYVSSAYVQISVPFRLV